MAQMAVGFLKASLLQGDVSLHSVATMKLLSLKFLRCSVDFIDCEKLMWMQHRRTASSQKI